MLDDLDRRILEILVEDPRISLKELAQQVGLSSPSTSERLGGLRSAASSAPSPSTSTPGARLYAAGDRPHPAAAGKAASRAEADRGHRPVLANATR